jgi:Cdc6-like AAA superfamily ATPase
MSVIENYVALVETRRNAVLQLYNLTRSFIKPQFTQTNAKSSVSCLLVDAPGRGKTVLVRALAKKLGISYLPFNITEMVNREDIINSFDVIVTTQARDRDRAVLVFVR